MVKSLWLLMNFPSDLWESLMVRLPEVMGHDFQALIFLMGRSEILQPVLHLVDGLEHVFYDFPYWELGISSSQLTNSYLIIFQRGRYTTNQYSVPVLHFRLNMTEYCHAKQPEDSPSSSWSTPKGGRSCGDPYGAQSSMASIAILDTHAFFQVGAGHMFDHICILLDIIYSLSLGFTICFHYFPQLFQCILLSGYIKIYQHISKVYQVNSLNFCGYLSGKSQNLGRTLAKSLLWIVQLESQ